MLNANLKTLFTTLLVGAATTLAAVSAWADGGARSAGVRRIALPGANTYPEGIVATKSGHLFVTGFGNGSIYRVDPRTATVETFKAPGEDGLSSAVGLAVDEARRRLWIANFSFATFSSELVVFDIDSGRVLARLPSSRSPSFFNELAIDDSGRVYVSDTAAPVIWSAGPDLTSVDVFVEDPLLENPDPARAFGLNGLALTPDGKYLVASVMDRIVPGDGRLVRIGLADHSVQDIRLFGRRQVIDTFGGSDGMFFDGQRRLRTVNVTPPASVVTAYFDKNFEVALLTARRRFDSVYNRPTSSARLDGRLWTVNSQLDHIIDDENGALDTPPDLPFEIVGVPAPRF